MTPRFFKLREIDAEALGHLRAYWYGREPFAGERERVRPRLLRFAVLGGLDGDGWHRSVAELLNGSLPETHAPCVRDRDAVRAVRRDEFAWETLEPREWQALRAMGLRADLALTLAEPEEDEAPRPPSGRPEVTRVTLLPALHAALTEWGEDALRPQADALFSALRAEVLAVIDAEGLRGAARALGVSVSTLQRWRSPGGCLASIPEAPETNR